MFRSLFRWLLVLLGGSGGVSEPGGGLTVDLGLVDYCWSDVDFDVERALDEFNAGVGVGD